MKFETPPAQESPEADKFALMERSHDKYFGKYLELCRSKQFDPDVQTMIDEFVIGRIGAKKGVRAFVCDEMFKAAGGTEDIDRGYLLAAIELQLAAGYCYNVAADSKGGYESEEGKKVAFKTHSQVEELALAGIDKINVSEEKKEEIKKYFDHTWKTFYEAEVIDTIVNLFKNRGKLPQDIISEIENFDGGIENTYGLSKQQIIEVLKSLPNEPIQDYALERTYKLNAVQLENIGKVIGILLDLDDEKVHHLCEYGKNYGIEMQIVNDIQDFSLDLTESESPKATREKNKSDVFSDLKKGKITWPLKYALELDPESQELLSKYAGREDLNETECEEVRQRLIADGSLARCVLEAVHYEKKANSAIRKLGDTPSKNMLQQISAEQRLSKYIYVLEKRYGVKLQPSKNQRKQMKITSWWLFNPDIL